MDNQTFYSLDVKAYGGCADSFQWESDLLWYQKESTECILELQ